MKRSIGAKTLIVPTPTWIVGAYDKQGEPNGMTAAWDCMLLDRPAWPCRTQGDVQLRQYCPAEGIHGQRAIAGPGKGGRLLRVG